MESNYYFIFDNAFEIIPLVPSFSFAFQITISSKYYWEAIYHFTHLIIKNQSFYPGSYDHLILFRKLQKLNIEDKQILDCKKISVLNKLIHLNELEINMPSLYFINYEVLNLSNLSKLTNVCFHHVSFYHVQWNFHSIRKIKAHIDIDMYDNLNLFSAANNLESLSLNIDSPNINATICIPSSNKLTKLTIRDGGTDPWIYISFSNDLFTNIIRMNLNNVKLMYTGKIFSSLIYLSLSNLMDRTITLPKAYNLKKLKINNVNLTINFSDYSDIMSLKILNIRWNVRGNLYNLHKLKYQNDTELDVMKSQCFLDLIEAVQYSSKLKYIGIHDIVFDDVKKLNEYMINSSSEIDKNPKSIYSLSG